LTVHQDDEENGGIPLMRSISKPAFFKTALQLSFPYQKDVIEIILEGRKMDLRRQSTKAEHTLLTLCSGFSSRVVC